MFVARLRVVGLVLCVLGACAAPASDVTVLPTRAPVERTEPPCQASLTACASGSQGTAPASADPRTPLASAEPIALPTRPQPPGTTPEPCPASLTSGTLVSHPEWGIALDTQSGVIKVSWPYGYHGRMEGDRIALVNGAGAVLAYTGDKVWLGGGQANGGWHACGDVTPNVGARPQ